MDDFFNLFLSMVCFKKKFFWVTLINRRKIKVSINTVIIFIFLSKFLPFLKSINVPLIYINCSLFSCGETPANPSLSSHNVIEKEIQPEVLNHRACWAPISNMPSHTGSASLSWSVVRPSDHQAHPQNPATSPHGRWGHFEPRDSIWMWDQPQCC